MAYHENYHRRAGASGIPTALMVIAMLAAATSGAWASRKPILPASAKAEAVPAVPAPAPTGHSWTREEIVDLIAAIEQSRSDGLDPGQYGLAALRSELEQQSQLWGGTGTPQLDALAQTAALTLANDYRTRAGGSTASAGDLNAALNEGDLKGWITGSHTAAAGVS
jgi:hypothetical protein